MSGQFQPIEIPPGVVSLSTKNQRSSNWSHANLVRWVEGNLTPVGGQSQYSYTFASRCKAIHGWYDLAGVYHIAYVCERNVYVDTGGTLAEITPVGGWPAPPGPGSGGYGDGLYSDGTYGTPRSGSSTLPIDFIPNVWSVDNFGALLLVMNSVTGDLLQWDPAAPATPLTVVTGSPKGRLFTVTPERFVMIFGQYDDGTPDNGFAWRFGWCDQDNITDWNFASVTNQAGFLDIQPASPIMTAIAGKFGTLIFTGKKAYVSRYIGLPYVYDYVELADACTPWSPASIATTSSLTIWMSQQGMFSFDGTSIAPIVCKIRSWIAEDIDPAWVRERACAVHLGRHNEFWWFFPQNGQQDNTRVAIYNYREGWWSQGQMARSAGITSAYNAEAVLANGTIAYQHELGPTYSLDADLPYAETFDLNLTSGTQLATLKQIIPDIGGDVGNVIFSFFAGMSRSQGLVGDWGPSTLIRPDGYVDARVTGRDIRMRIGVQGPRVQPFTIGQNLVDFAVRGDR